MWGDSPTSLYERQGASPPLNGDSPHTREANAGSKSQRIAQQLIRHKVAFDVLDVDRASVEQLTSYSALILPSAAVMSRQAQHRLTEYAQEGGFLVLIGGELPTYDEALAPCSVLADEVKEQIYLLSREKMLALDAAGWASTLASSGAQIRLAWADSPQVDVGIRYGAGSEGSDGPDPEIVFLTVVNRGQDDLNGFVNYLASDGAHQQIELSLASAQVGLVALREGQVLSAVLSRGKVQAAHNGFAFDGRLGVVATGGDALMLSARESGTFHLSRASGWDRIVAQRLLLSGRLLEHPVRAIGRTLAVDYLSEDELGETDLILLLDRERPLDGEARRYLDTSLACRRGMLGEAVRLAEALRYELSDIEARAEVVPTDSISLTPARDALSEAIRSIDKAARYAQGLRDGLEGRTAVGGADIGVGRLRVTAQALVHLVACRDVAARAGAALAEAGDRSRVPDAPWTVDAYASRLSDLRSGIAPLCRELVLLLYQLRVDLQVREVDPEFAERVQGSVTHLLHILHDL
jgi:hypothetical protein